MKWPQSQVDIVTKAYQQFIEDSVHSVEDIRLAYRDSPTMLVMYNIDRLLQPSLNKNIEYQMYPKGCNDTHRATMLKYVGKKVGLL